MSELSVCASPADSPQWRKGPRCKPVLCNACGTRFLRTRSLGKVTSQTYIHAALVGCGSTVCHTAVICSFCAAFRAVFVPAYARSPATVKYCNLRYLVCAQHCEAPCVHRLDVGYGGICHGPTPTHPTSSSCASFRPCTTACSCLCYSVPSKGWSLIW